MINHRAFIWAIGAVILSLSPVQSIYSQETKLMDRFENNPEREWRFFSDRVMGGVSDGSLRFGVKDGQKIARMKGDVSTANNGGFIQFRKSLDQAPPASAQGVVLKVRGNNQSYFIHLRTNGTRLPWQYYQASFDTTTEWQTIKLPFSAFKASGSWLRKTPKATSLRSVGVVAYGRDHQALIEVAEIGFY